MSSLVVENETVTISTDKGFYTVFVGDLGILNIEAKLTCRAFTISGSGGYSTVTGLGSLILEGGFGLQGGFYDDMGNILYHGFLTRILETTVSKVIRQFIPQTQETLQNFGLKTPLYFLEFISTGSLSNLQAYRQEALDLVGTKGWLVTSLIEWLPLQIVSCSIDDVAINPSEIKVVLMAVKVI